MAWVSALTTIQSGNGYIDSVQYMVARGRAKLHRHDRLAV